MQRWRWVSLFVVALALAGCGGGGGTVSVGDPNANGDDGEMSLVDKWRQFEDGTPTLGMTNAQVSDAWRSVARQSTHRVVLAGPSSIGNDPSSTGPVETFPDFPVEAEACSPGDCDLEPPPDLDGTWAFAPVLEHDGIPVAEFSVRFTDTVTLEATGTVGLEEDRRGPDEAYTDIFDTLAYGGWLDYTHFNVLHTRWCTVGQPGCAEIDDADTRYAGGGVLGFMAGRYAGTTPPGTGSAAWTGVMVGMEDADAASSGRERPDVFLGDASIRIDDLSAPEVDVSFTNIHNVSEGTRRRDLSWQDLRVEDGLFGTVSPQSGGERPDYLAGMFTGPGHQEVGGEFLRDGIAGAFGARRE